MVPEEPSFSWTHIQSLINTITNSITSTGSDSLVGQVILPVAGIVVFGMIIWGGFKYIQGDPEAGKKTLTAAVIGLVIVALSAVIVTQVINIIEGDIPSAEEGGDEGE